MTRAASLAAEVCGFSFDGHRCRQRGPHRCHQRVSHVLAFFREVLVHTKGDWASQPFAPPPWQRDRILAPLFGQVFWDPKRRRYVRQYRSLYLYVPRKNGKSELTAGIMLYLLAGEGEQGAELYGLALDKDQAGHVFRAAVRMVELSPALRERLEVVRSTGRIVDHHTDSFFAVLAGDAPGALGSNPFAVYLDELLTQPNRELYDAMRTGMGARAQPLIILATTAESAPHGFAAQERQWSERVLEDPTLDPQRLVVMYRWPVGADWREERNWYRVNPALGDFLELQTLRAEFHQALHNPPAERSFRQYRLNQPVNAIGRAISLGVWDQGKAQVSEAQLAGQLCWGGLDLASTQDLAALAWVFPAEPPQEGYSVLWRCWIPSERLEELDRRTAGLASTWAQAGWLLTTEGPVLDHHAVHRQLQADRRAFNVQEVAFDPWGAVGLVQDLLDDGFHMVEVRQGWASMAAPVRETLRLVTAGLLRHGGHPVARWCAANAVTRVDTAGNLKWDRERSQDKIDAIVALTMAISRASVRPKPRKSAYEQGGLVVV